MFLKVSVVFLCAIFGLGACSQAQQVQWVLDANSAKDPLLLKIDGNILHVLFGLGPVYDINDNILGPRDYKVELNKVVADHGYEVYFCSAKSEDEHFSAEYTLKFKRLDDYSIEMLVDGTDNVTSFEAGNIIGTDESFKQFYTGERDAEAHANNDGYPPILFTSSSGFYLNGFWDTDYTNACRPTHRLPPKKNFITKNPPITCDPSYAKLTNKKRLPLKERFVFRFSADMWKVYGPVLNEPSPYGKELSEMVYFDGWTEKFCHGIEVLKFIKEAVPEQIKLYTIIQHWASWSGWDKSNPDAYRIPDHTMPLASYGSPAQLKEYLFLAKSRGRVGFRYNYMHIADESWSFKEGIVKKALKSSGETAWFSDFHTIGPLITRQETEVVKIFNTNTSFHDQWGSMGTGYPVVNFDANVPDAGTVASVRKMVRQLCLTTKDIQNGPLSSESLISEFLIGKYLDTGDFAVFAADQRDDFSPEYKLRRLHQLTTVHGMGLGYRYFFTKSDPNWRARGQQKYFESDVDVDGYRACEALYGNGGYLYVKGLMRKVHALTECMTIGIAQRYYAMQPVDYIKYSNGGRWKAFDKILSESLSLDELHQYYKRFHIRYSNGCHVWVNRANTAFEVKTPDNEVFTLGKNCWIIYTEDGKLICYTAEVNDPVVADFLGRVDFCEDKNLGIKYVNPRTLHEYKGVSVPTVWVKDKIHYRLKDPQTTFGHICEKEY
jgi:hypothetical protein